MITLTPRKRPEIQLNVRSGGLQQYILPVETTATPLQMPPTDVSNPMGYATQSKTQTPSTGLQTARPVGTMLPSTDNPESFVRGLNAVTEQYQPTRSTESAVNLEQMAKASTARNNRNTGLRFQSFLGGQTTKGVSPPKASATDNAWFGAMSDAEKARAASITNAVERGKYINSLDLNTRATEKLRQQQNKIAEGLEHNMLNAKKSENSEGRLIATWATGNNQYSARNYQGTDPGVAPEEMRFLSDKQQKTIAGYAQTGDFQSISDYYNAIKPNLLALAREELVTNERTLGYNHPVYSIIPEGTYNSFNGIPVILNTIYNKIKEATTGEWTPMDPNSHVFDLVASAQAISEGANERIMGNGANAPGIENPALRAISKTTRSGASSALTNGLQLLVGSALGLGPEALSNFTLSVMGTSAAGQTIYRDLKDGKTTSEALTDGVANGVIEVLTEKVSLDRFIKELPGLRGDNAAELAKAFWDTVKWQAPIEGLEEIAGNVLDQTWDILYSGENSEYSKRTQAILTQKILNNGGPENYSPTQGDAQSAREQAFMDLFVTQSAEAFASAVFSSFLLTGAPTVYHGATGRFTTTRAGNILKNNGMTQNEVAKGQMFPGTKAAEIAGQLQTVLDEKGAKAVPANQLGRLAAANASALNNALNEMTGSDNALVAAFAQNLLDNPREIANKNLMAADLERILNIKRSNTTNLEGMTAAANDEVRMDAATAEQTQAANPDAVVLSPLEHRIHDAFDGMSLAKVRKRAAIIQRFIDGKEVTQRQFKTIDPTSSATKLIFAEVTGVDIPDGVTGDALFQAYKLGSKQHVNEVVQQARAEVEAETPQEPVPASVPVPTLTPAPSPASTVSTPDLEAQTSNWRQIIEDDYTPYFEGLERLRREGVEEEARYRKNHGKANAGANNPFDFHYAIVPADSLIISNDEYGNVNPNFPKELQPRDRTRGMSQIDVSRMAKQLDYTELIDSHSGKTGAPIVDENGVVISGNGRSAAILTAYQNQYESGAKYADYIRTHAEDFGLDPSQIPDNPVLVRVADNVKDKARLARDLNVSDTVGYSSTETANIDKENIEDILELLKPGKNGNLLNAENRPFIAAFVQSVPESQRGTLVDKYGNLNQTGKTRMTTAILAYAYEDTDLIAQFAESLDAQGMQRAANALTKAAPEIAQLKLDMKTGNAHNVPVVRTILDALELYAESRHYAKTVSEIVDQASTDTNYGPNETLVAEVIEYYNRKSEAGFYDFLQNLVDAIRDFGVPNQYSILGGAENAANATIESAIDTAVARANERENGRTNFQRRTGQFGGQSVPSSEDSGGGSQSESGRQDVGGNRQGVAEDVGEDAVNPQTLAMDAERNPAVHKSKAISREESKWTTERVEEPKTKTPKSLSEIIEQARHDFGINVTIGHVRGKNTLAQYSDNDHGIRTRIANDIVNVAHELGHHIDNKYSLTSESKIPSAEMQELIDHLDENFANQYKPEELPGEAIAEYIRQFLTNSDMAALDFPGFTDFLKRTLSGTDLIALSALADEVNGYLSLDLDSAQSSIRFSDEKSPDARTVFERTSDFITSSYQKAVDSLHSIHRLAQKYGSNFDMRFYNSAYLDSMADYILKHDLTNLDGQFVGNGLKTVLSRLNLKDKNTVRLFNEYLVVKHGPECLDEGYRVFANPLKNNRNWMNQRAAAIEQEHQEFRETSESLYGFIRQMYQTFAVDTGLYSQETLDGWWDRWKHYVPFHRDMSQNRGTRGAESRGGGNKGFVNQRGPVKGQRGSGRDIIAPLDNIIQDLVVLVNVGGRNQAMLGLADAARDLGIDATYMEQIPEPQEKQIVNARAKLNEFQRLFNGTNIGQAAKDMANDILGDMSGLMTQFTAGKASGDVITVMRDGKAEYWKINDPELLESLQNLSTPRVTGLAKAFSTITRNITSNITGRNIVWSVVSNMPRDLQTYMIFTGETNKASALLRWGKAIGTAAAAGINQGILKNGKINPMYAEYLSMGGFNSSAYASDKQLPRNVIQALTGKTMLQRLNPISAYADFIEFASNSIEAGPRFATYSWAREHGMSPQEAFYAAMDVTVNFRRGGILSRQANVVLPFFNASVQGTDKALRFFSADYGHEQNAKGKIIARVGTYTVLSIILGALIHGINHADDDKKESYERLSGFTKNNYFVFPIDKDKYYAVPKGRELMIMESFTERLLDRVAADDRHAFDEFYGYVVDNTTPSAVGDVLQGDLIGALGGVSMLGPLTYIGANRDFRGRPIVSNALKELNNRDQYTRKTHGAAVLIGQATNISPEQIDFFMSNVWATPWKYSKALFPEGSEYRDLTLGAKTTTVKDSLYSTDIVNRAYDRTDQSGKDKRSNPDDVEKAILYKNNSNITTFYSNWYKLVKDLPESDALRENREAVLETMLSYEQSLESDNQADAYRVVESAVKRAGDSSLLPSVMESTVKDKNGDEYQLDGTQYLDYQTRYLGLYYDIASKILPSATTTEEMEAMLRQSKSEAQRLAKNELLNMLGAPIPKNQDKYSAVSTEDYVKAKAVTSGVESVKYDGGKKDGETVTVDIHDMKDGKETKATIGSESVEKALNIRRALKLDKEQYYELFESLGIAKSVWGKSEKSLESILSRIEKKADAYKEKGNTP